MSETTPKLSREPIILVDSTPDSEYPIRILRAYRVNATALWKCEGMSDATTAVYEQMNYDQLARARLLDAAIHRLEACATRNPEPSAASADLGASAVT